MAKLEWPKHVGGYYVIIVHSLTQVHFLAVLKMLYNNCGCPEGVRKTSKMCGVIVSAAAEIQTGHLLNTNLERYRLS
jgi:hypothetical protein